MTGVQIKGAGGKAIRSFSDWDMYALPSERRVRQWKEGRSAFELGWNWTVSGRVAVPSVLLRLLESHKETAGIEIRSGVTEHETTLPLGNRGPRCHDLALKADQHGRAVTICIEAKADEPFGGNVAEELRKARQRPVTRIPERLDWLSRSLLGLPAFADDERLVLAEFISRVPYQLLSAVAGTMLEARLQGATKAIFLVHEFRTKSTMDVKLEANANELNRFVRLLRATNEGADEDMRLQAGHIVGPISIIERATAGAVTIPWHIPLLIGKIRTERLA